MSGLMRPSAAGPMLAPPDQLSSLLLSVLPCLMPPTEMTFLAHACGRAFWLPRLLIDCRMLMREWSNRIWSRSWLSDVYAVVCVLPQLLLCTTHCHDSDGFTSSAVWAHLLPPE